MGSEKSGESGLALHWEMAECSAMASHWVSS